MQAHLKVIWSQPSIKCESGLGLRKILETTNEHLRALEEVGEPTHAWNSLLIFWITEKLDNESKKQWQLAPPGTDLLQWQDLVKILDSRSRALELGNVKDYSQAQTSNTNNTKQDRRIQSYSIVSVCNETWSEPHKFHASPNFKNLLVSDRTKFVRSRQLCFNCLQSGHGVGACTSKFTCRECKMKHHTLLHRDKSLQANSSIERTIQSNAASTETIKKYHETVVNSHCNATTECRLHSFSSHSSPFTNVLLPTAYFSLRDKAGNEMSMRALLDSGSQASFITEAKAKTLILPIEKTQTPIAALGAAKTRKTLGFIAMKLNYVIGAILHVIPKITNEIPTKPIDISLLRDVNHLQLADPTFKVPGKIDILLGADVLEEVMLDNRIKGNGVVIRESLFGWIVSGPVQKSESENSFPILTSTSLIASSSCTEDLSSKYWELESVPDKNISQTKRRNVKFNSIKPQSAKMLVNSLLNCHSTRNLKN